jgi:hypothetical protein
MSNDRIQRLEKEQRETRARLEQLRRELEGASASFKQTRGYQAGVQVNELAGAVRLAELAHDGVTEELERARRPKRVEIYGPRDELERQRALILQQRAIREHDLAERIAAERARCPTKWSEQSVQVHLQQTLGIGLLPQRKSAEQEARLLSHLDEQLAELDRRAEQRNDGPSAA